MLEKKTEGWGEEAEVKTRQRERREVMENTRGSHPGSGTTH